MKGYDMFFTDKDVKDGMECNVCGRLCDVSRNVNSPTSWGESMAKKSHWHDEFRCPNRDEPWHKQALDLLMELEKTNSPSLKKIMAEDLSTIIKKKKVVE